MTILAFTLARQADKLPISAGYLLRTEIQNVIDGATRHEADPLWLEYQRKTFDMVVNIDRHIMSVKPANLSELLTQMKICRHYNSDGDSCQEYLEALFHHMETLLAFNEN